MKRALLLALFVAGASRAQQEPTPFWMPPPPPKKEEAKPKPAKKKKPVQLEPVEIRPKEKAPPVAEKPRPPPSKPKPQEIPEPIYLEPAPRAVEAPRKPPPIPIPAPIQPSPKAARKTPPPAPAEAPVPLAAPVAPPVASHAPMVPPATPPVIAEPAPIILPEPEPTAPDLRRFSFNATIGSWAKTRSDGNGRAWELAYGLRIAFAFTESIEMDLSALRSSGTEGSPFVSTSATHNLFVLRAFWVLGNDKLAFLAGAGGGVALAQTHYSLQPTTDGSAPPSGLDATAPKPVMEITAAGRWRFLGGLEARAEVSGMMRDGRLEFVPLIGLGASF